MTPVAWVTARGAAVESAARVLVAARVGDHLLTTAFHPELTPSTAFHALFAQMAARSAGRPLALEAGAEGRAGGLAGAGVCAGEGDGVSGAGPLQAGASGLHADIVARRVR